MVCLHAWWAKSFPARALKSNSQSGYMQQRGQVGPDATAEPDKLRRRLLCGDT